MTSEEKMRDEFESWCRNEQLVDSGRDAIGRYRSQEVDDMWYAWKASRESLVVKVNSAACHDATAGDVLDAIENSGVKWEVEQ